MSLIFKNVYEGLITAWDGFWTLWLANIFWILLCLPIITAPLAFTGLYYTMHELANGESLEWKTFFYGIRIHFSTGIRWFGWTFSVGLALLLYTLSFTTSGDNSGQGFGGLLSGIPLGLLVLWAILNNFTFPLMLDQPKPSFWMALRHSAFFYLKSPGMTLTFVIFNASVLALCTWLVIPWLILGASLTALMANVFVKNRLAEIIAKKP